MTNKKTEIKIGDETIDPRTNQQAIEDMAVRPVSKEPSGEPPVVDPSPTMILFRKTKTAIKPNS